MKRSQPPRSDPEKIRAWQQRSRKPLKRTELKRSRKPIPKVGAKALRERAAWEACKAVVRVRSRGWCEGNVPGICPPRPHRATQTHHVWPEDRDAGVHDPERCRHLCARVHAWVHDYPALAKPLGLLRPDEEEA